jgi:alkylation response protein AidB-like acyl-CoA dehydrogenase
VLTEQPGTVLTSAWREAERQRMNRAAFRAFADEAIVPFADAYDRDQRLPSELVAELGQRGYLGALVPESAGGPGLDMLTFGALHEEIGRGCSSVRSLLTVHSMVAYAITRWGTPEQRTRWLRRLGTGDVVGAFALSEPEVGSDARSIETTATATANGFVLHGRKKWITAGQIADLFLIFARSERGICAFLVERGTPGFSTRPIQNVLGTRASMLAEIHLDNCTIPTANLLGPQGFGLASVATSALDIGRYSVAVGCVGIGQACLEASLAYASARRQGGAYLKDHQLVSAMISDMLVNVRAARLLCEKAGRSKEVGHPETIMDTMIAKYFASTVAARAANDAVQIHGANGCSDDYSVARYYRDAKIMEIIEGSTQIQQVYIAQHGYQSAAEHPDRGSAADIVDLNEERSAIRSRGQAA